MILYLNGLHNSTDSQLTLFYSIYITFQPHSVVNSTIISLSSSLLAAVRCSKLSVVNRISRWLLVRFWPSANSNNCWRFRLKPQDIDRHLITTLWTSGNESRWLCTWNQRDISQLLVYTNQQVISLFVSLLCISLSQYNNSLTDTEAILCDICLINMLCISIIRENIDSINTVQILY